MFKRILKIVGIVLLVIVLAAAILPFIYKDKIVALIKEEANKNLNAKVDFGSFDLSIFKSFPDFTFTLNQLSIAGIDEFKGDTLACIQKLYLNVNVMSVIKGEKISIKAITIDHPRILAKVLKNGKTNWDIAKPSTDTTKKEANAQPTKFKLGLKKFAIVAAHIVYDDQKGGTYAELENFTHELKGDFTQDIFLIHSKTTADAVTAVSGGVKYLNKVALVLKLDVDADMPNMKFTLKENELALNELELGLDGYVAVKKDMEMDLKFNVSKTDFRNILSLVPGVYSKDIKGLKSSGKLALEGFAKGTKTEKLLPAFGLKLVIDNGMFQYPSLPTAVNNVQVNLNVNNSGGSADNTVISLTKFHVEIGNDPFDALAMVKTPISDPDLNASLKGKIDLGNISKIVPLEKDMTIAGLVQTDIQAAGKLSTIKEKRYEDFKAAGQLSISNLKYNAKSLTKGIDMSQLLLTFTPKNVTLNNMEIRMGNSDFKMTGTLENFIPYALKGETIVGTLNLTSKLVDLNDLMGSSDSKKPAEPAKGESTPMKVVEIPGNIDFTLNSNIGQVLFSNMDMVNMKGTILVKDKAVKMQNLSFNMLDGSMTINGGYDSKDLKKPAITFAMNISSFDVQKTVQTFPAVKKMAAIVEKATGKYSTKLQLDGILDDKMSPVLNSLNGGGTLQTQDVVIDKFEAITKVAEALKQDKYKKIELKNVNISYKFQNGRVIVQPFDMSIGGVKAKFGGSSGFDQTIDYVMNMDIPRKELGGAANDIINGVAGQIAAKTGINANIGEIIKMDALIGGTVTKPSVRLAMRGSEGGKSISDDLKAKAQAEIDKKKAELEAKARAEADKAKADAEARARTAVDKAKSDAEARAKAEADRLKKEAEQKAKDAAKDKLKGLWPK